MRIVSLLPAATEMIAALGREADLVGISHECDYPPAICHLPRVTTTPVDPERSSAQIDREVRELQAAGHPVIGVDGALLTALAPDLIVTQSLCEVCAVADGVVQRLGAVMQPAPEILSLEARNLEGIWDDIRTLGHILGEIDAAHALVQTLQVRFEALTGEPYPGTSGGPRVLAVEWLDPLYLAGHWVPELVNAAGGINTGLAPGAHSVTWSWRDAAALAPDLILLMLCGFSAERAELELSALADPEALALFDATPTWIMDGNALTSRPGPRVVEAAEQIHSILRGRPIPGPRRATIPTGARSR